MNPKIRKALDFLQTRFGIPPDVFDEFELVDYGDIWVMTPEAAKFEIKAFARRGIRLVRVFKRGDMKFTTAGMQIFGKFATKNIVYLTDRQQLEAYLRGEDIRVGQLEGVEEGQVIVKWNDDVLGSAVYRNGKLKNQLPKGRRVLGARR